ncbi:MAG TPA: alpha/beta hydrolase domain-containing protein, partial [Blastocatellia bacterium]
MKKLNLKLCLAALLSICSLAAGARAEVTRVEILSRSDVLAGRAFGLAGAYEKIIAKVYFAVDPHNAHNQVIVDLDKAPRNARNQVEFSADLYILKPKEMTRGNDAVLLEVANRGGKAMVRFFNRGRGSSDPSTEAEMGDGFLMRQGFTLVWVGWQFDTPQGRNSLRLYAPVATEAGKALTGLVRSDFVFSSKVYSASLGHRGQNAQPVLDPQSKENILTVRDTVLGARRVIAQSEWQFANFENGKATPDPAAIYLKSGFEPGKIYEVVYRTQNPTVAGLGLAAVRDLISYFKYQADAVVSVRRAYGFGISQSGRFLRHFLYQGFNADERDRQVFDAIDAHVAGGGRGSFNHRFAEPSRDASPFSTFFYPTDIFPFTDVEQTDPETGETDGLLTHSKNSKALPKIFYTFSSYEYWGRAASLIHTTIDGKADAPLMDNVRIYYFVGGQHGPGPFPPAKSALQGVPLTTQMTSPNDYTWSMRALLLAMDRWVKDGTPPPQSQYPRIADGTLVRPEGVKFPRLPGIEVPRTIHEAYRVDYGPQFKQGIQSLEPPRVGKPFPAMVPQVDRDGIDLAGIRMPEVAVPLATYTGWNYRDPRTGSPNELVDFAGSYIPFARTRAERERTLDPRLSIEERYQGREQYLGLFAEAALKLVKDGY